MEINDFIKNFADQFDETNLSEFKANTNFRELDEWSSLIAFAVLSMIERKYGVKLQFSEMRTSNTIGELFDLVYSHKK